MTWSVTFFDKRVEAGILGLPAGMLARFLRYSERMELFGPDLGMPHTRSMGGGLFELRIKAPEGIGRVFYCTVIDRRIVFLHHFVKKTGKTPPKELDIARKRMKELKMASNLKRFKARALARPGVKKAYDDLAEEFAFLDAVLQARAQSGLSQAEVAARVGTTQSAIARLESAATKHSPSIATLRRYANALGYKLEIRLVKKSRRSTTRSTKRATKTSARRSV